MKDYSIVDLISKKASGEELTSAEIQYFIHSVTNRSLDQVQLGAMLMALYLRGMTQPETTDLTGAMTGSGHVLQWPADWLVVDKHSTGGVGDKVSLPLSPALAACGFKVPMISGRGLGHTGGTLDKLESIPGFCVSQNPECMLRCLTRVGCCIVGQTADIVPADSILYANRDITNTVGSIPLITSSVISKKAAEGLKALVLDVKFGSGAFMKTEQEARIMAKSLVETARGVGIKTAALLTCMDSPIGLAVGNATEVEEAVQCLRGGGPDDLRQLVCALGGQLVQLMAQGTAEEGRRRIEAALSDGTALAKFRDMLVQQGVAGDVAAELCSGDPWKVLPVAQQTHELTSQKDGYVAGIDAMTVARVSRALGAGRRAVADVIDHAVGVSLCASPGDFIRANQVWVKVQHNGQLQPALTEQLQLALTLQQLPVQCEPRITDTIHG